MSPYAEYTEEVDAEVAAVVERLIYTNAPHSTALAFDQEPLFEALDQLFANLNVSPSDFQWAISKALERIRTREQSRM